MDVNGPFTECTKPGSRVGSDNPRKALDIVDVNQTFVVTENPMIIDESTTKNFSEGESSNLKKDFIPTDTVTTTTTDTINNLLFVFREPITESIVETTDVTEIELEVNDIPKKGQYTKKESENPNSQTECNKHQKTLADVGPVNYQPKSISSNVKTDGKSAPVNFFDTESKDHDDLVTTESTTAQLCFHFESTVESIVKMSIVEKQIVEVCAENLPVIDIFFEETPTIVTSECRSTSTIPNKDLCIETVVERVDKGLTTDTIDNTTTEDQLLCCRELITKPAVEITDEDLTTNIVSGRTESSTVLIEASNERVQTKVERAEITLMVDEILSKEHSIKEEINFNGKGFFSKIDNYQSIK